MKYSDTVMSTSTEQEQRVGSMIRALRDERRLSLRTLATKAGFSPSFLSQVENGQASPSIASLERIAAALGVTLGQFFLPSAAEPTVVRAAERADFVSSWSHAQVEMLGVVQPWSLLEPMMLTLDPGGRSGSRPVTHGGEEFAIVFEGEVNLTLGDALHHLAQGDAATFQAESPHQWENIGSEPARIVIVSARQQR